MVLFGKVDITDLGNAKMTLGSENRGYHFTRVYGESDVLRITVSDPGRTHLANYPAGSKVELYSDSTDPPTVKVFRGVIETVNEEYSGGRRTLILNCTELFYYLLMRRVVFEDYRNLLAGDIIKNLNSTYLAGFSDTNIQDTDYQIEQITWAGQYLIDAFDDVAKLSFAQYYCDPLLNLFLYPQHSRASGLSLTEDDIHGVIKNTLGIDTMQNVVFVLGSEQIDKDVNSETTGGNVSMHTNYIAVKFQPTEISLRKIALNLEKVGSPTTGLGGEIVEDKSGLPTGPEIAGFSFRAGDIGAQAWYESGAEAELDTGKSYWLILFKNGDVSNTYKWHHDNSSANSHGESSDGVSWSEITSSYKPTFRIFMGSAVISQSRNSSSVTTYDFDGSGFGIQGVFMKASIVEKLVAKRLAMRLVKDTSREAQRIPDLVMKNPTTIPIPGDSIHLNFSNIGNLNRDFFMNRIDVDYGRGKTATGINFMSIGIADNKEVV